MAKNKQKNTGAIKADLDALFSNKSKAIKKDKDKKEKKEKKEKKTLKVVA